MATSDLLLTMGPLRYNSKDFMKPKHGPRKNLVKTHTIIANLLGLSKFWVKGEKYSVQKKGQLSTGKKVFFRPCSKMFTRHRRVPMKKGGRFVIIYSISKVFN